MTFLKKLALASMLAVASSAAFADTLNFDSFTGSLNTSNYGGFTWSNFSVTNAATSTSGYHNGTVSGTNVAFNAFSNPASFSNANGFTLNNAFFTGAWNDGVSVHVVGTGSSSYTKDFTVNTSGPTNVVFNWSGLTSVTVSSSGGVHHDGYAGNGSHVAMDNLTINAPVPEPETYAMMIVGLAALGAVARRRKAA